MKCNSKASLKASSKSKQKKSLAQNHYSKICQKSSKTLILPNEDRKYRAEVGNDQKPFFSYLKR